MQGIYEPRSLCHRISHPSPRPGSEPDLSRLRYTPEQKPFLPEGPAFNLSHSGNRVICLAGGQVPLSTWYPADRAGSMLETPEYTFSTNELRGWPAIPHKN